MGNEKSSCGGTNITEASKVVLSSSKRLIGIFFGCQNITAALFLNILRKIVAVKNTLEDPGNTSYFMQYSAHQKWSSEIFHLLDERSYDRVIILLDATYWRSNIDWPSYPPDLTICDFFLRGEEYIKDAVYRENITTSTVHFCCMWNHSDYNVSTCFCKFYTQTDACCS